MLGYRSNPDWRDMSDYLVHFTKDGPPSGDAYRNSLGILSQGVLRPGSEPFGSARRDFYAQGTQLCTCFSEIPLDRLGRLAGRRSRFGIGFRKDFIIANGGAPVWYVDFGSPAHTSLEALKAEAAKAADPRAHPLWRLTPFIDVTGRPPKAPYTYNFDWEREWRVPGPLRFTPADVALLFIPAELHDAAWAFFEDAEREHLGPGYFCPYLDPQWPEDRIAEALRSPRVRSRLG